MRKALLAFVAGLLATAGMTACSPGGNGEAGSSSGTGGGSGAGKIGVILPDTRTSQVSLDSESGAAVLAEARAAGVETIDFDRLTLGGGANYYVS